MPRQGLPAKALKLYTAIVTNKRTQAFARTTLQGLMMELQLTEAARDALDALGGNDPGSIHWKAWCHQKNRAIEYKTAIKHLLNLWKPEGSHESP